MRARLLLALPIAIGLTAPAFGFQCPVDIGKIDAALAANAGLDPNLRSTIMTLRDTGQRLHKAGKHKEAVQTLGGAKQILGQLGVKID